MNKIQLRGERFNALIGAELKGAIVAQGLTAEAVARAIRIEPATLSRYMNGHRSMPVGTLVDASSHIGIDPAVLVERAWERLEKEIPQETPSDVLEPTSPSIVVPLHTQTYEEDDYTLVANDRDPFIEQEGRENNW